MSLTSSFVFPALAAALAISAASHGAIPTYTQVGSFAAPGGAWDVLPDGRLLSIVGSASPELQLQNSLNGSTYSTLASLPTGIVSSFGASLLSVSPNGSTFAIGDNNFSSSAQVHIFDLSGSTISNHRTVAATNYDAKWVDNSTLYVAGAGGPSPSITRINLTSPTTATSTVVINSIGDGSGGVGFHNNRLYTPIGFDFSFTREGELRSFDLSTLASATLPVSFTTGSLEGQFLSGASLDFDGLGNLIVSGFGSVAVINLTTLERIDLAPSGPTDFYTARYNAATDEILVGSYGSNGQLFRYAIPAPTTISTLTVLGLFASRRRRHA